MNDCSPCSLTPTSITLHTYENIFNVLIRHSLYDTDERVFHDLAKRASKSDSLIKPISVDYLHLLAL